MQEHKRFVLVSIVPHGTSDEDADIKMNELRSLVTTFGGVEIVRVIQKRDRPDNTTYLGKGKSEELAQLCYEEKIDAVVIDALVKPGQLYELKKVLRVNQREVDVWDRVDLILRIFDKHAQTAEAKLQIELAQMRHWGPRIYGMGMVLSRQGGGVGTRGIGETNTELMKRHWRVAMKKTRDKLDKLVANRERQMQHRKEIGLKTVAIVGYTNAGKTSLFNLLTKKEKLVENALFATLDSSVGKLYMPQLAEELLVSDTIGFIQDLPPQLIEAFKSTLQESIYADVLLHVIDASDEKMADKIRVVEDILRELGLEDRRRIYVFNKIDAIPDLDRDHLKWEYSHFSPLFISVHQKNGVEELIHQLENIFS